MNTSTGHDGTAPAAVDPVTLPGRSIDVVHLAARRAGLQIAVFSLYRSARRSRIDAHLHGDGPRDVHAALDVFAQLGIGDPAFDIRPGLSTVTAYVPALNADVVIVVDPVRPDPEPADPAALLADVDALRAQAPVVQTDDACHRDELNDEAAEGADLAELDERDAYEDGALDRAVPYEHGTAERGEAAMTGSDATGGRAVRFEARFDSVCPACRGALPGGSPASWLDGEAVHDTCARVGGVEVYDPR